MKKRKIGAALAAVVSAGMVGSTAFAAGVSYPDVPENEWFYPYVNYVGENRLMTGYDDGRFGAYDDLARGQFATILYRMAGEPLVSYTGRFPDVPAGAFYSSPAEWAGESQVITGYENGSFGAADKITREQLVTILYRYEQSCGEENLDGADYSDFQDAASVSGFAVEGMQWAIARGIIKGTGEGKLEPQGTVSRAVCATIISRYMGGEFGETENPAFAKEAVRVWEIVNEERAKEGLPALELDAKLTEAANIRAREILQKFSHTRPDGRGCFSVLQDMGIRYASSGENIALGQQTAEWVMDDWMHSEGHRANIMGLGYGKIGVGFCENGWVQLFAD